MNSIDRPNPATGASFWIRTRLLQLHRAWYDSREGIQKHPQKEIDLPLAAESRTPLYRETDPSERLLELGKVQNLRLVARRLNGVVVPAGEIFSFWKQVGPCTQLKGFVQGRQIQEGCVMPAIGGGICQLSNALYQLASSAGFEIVERHPHSRKVSGMSEGQDATVAWNYVDLRFRSDRQFSISAALTESELVVQLRAEKTQKRIPLRLIDSRETANSCATCGQLGCHHWHRIDRSEAKETTALLIEEWRPEYSQVPQKGDILFRPLDGKRWRRPIYDCPVEQYRQVQKFTVLALRQSLRRRKLASQGAARQEALLRDAEELALAYSRRLSFKVRHLVVSQTLLPFLWKQGTLGGRTFDVLMTRLPLSEIHARLDEAANRFPERKLLSDFRAPEWLVKAESEALQASSRQYTTSLDVSQSVLNPARLTPSAPQAIPWSGGRAIAFPGPTVARKGAFEVREVARRLGLEIVLLGSELEGDGFWEGIKTRRASRHENWLEGVGAVVLPSLLEDRPALLRQAIASGCPVVTTKAAGLNLSDNLITVEFGDVEGLVATLDKILSNPTPDRCLAH